MVNPTNPAEDLPAEQAEATFGAAQEAILTADVTRGVGRLLWLEGWSSLREVTLADGHRADIMAISKTGEILIVEIKVSLSDLRGDRKWHHYQAYTDRFAWAVPPELAATLDQDIYQPGETGLIVADRFEAIWQRPAQKQALAPARRKAVTLMFARLAADRVLRSQDPSFGFFRKR